MPKFLIPTSLVNGCHVFSNNVFLFSKKMYLKKCARIRRSSSDNSRLTVSVQYVAAQQGRGLAILPCFLAAQDPRLVPVLPGEVEITRQFWMYCREDLRKLKRITLLWDYIRDVTERNAPLLMGESHTMSFAD